MTPFEEMHPAAVVAAAIRENPDLGQPRWACSVGVDEEPENEVLMYSPGCGACDLRYILHQRRYREMLEQMQVVDRDGNRCE